MTASDLDRLRIRLAEAVIIDPHEILLLCVCVGSSILVARMCEFSRT